ncbi:MFS transporter [Frankia sp. CN7]|nr:MFS transporter [Frankia nepalensis]MBL7511792.1 MFS transporter [Frankia nepalensis]
MPLPPGGHCLEVSVSTSSIPSTEVRAPADGFTRRPGIALIVIAVSELMVALDATIVNVSLPAIQRDLGFSATDLSWVPNAYTLAAGGLLLLGGRIGDILGRRRVFLAGITLFTLASVFAGLAPDASWLLVARALQGAGAALTAPNALALVTTNFREGPERDRAVGVYAAVTGSGAVLGMIGGGMITTWASWPWIFYINVPVGIAVLVLTPRFLNESTRTPHRLDLPGAFTSTVGVAALVYGLVQAASEGWRDGRALIAFAVAAVLLVSFLIIEPRTREALTPLHLFLSRNRSGAYAVNLLMIASMLGMLFFQTQFFQEVLNFSPLRAGLAFIPMTLVMVPSTQLAAKLMTRFGPRPVIASGALVAAIAAIWLSQGLSADSGYVDTILGPLLLIGLGIGLMMVPLTAVAVYGIRPEESGAGSSLLSVTNQVGGSLGLAILVTAFGTASRDAARSPEGATPVEQAHHVLAEGVVGAFQLASIFLVAATVLAIVVINAKASELGSADPHGAAASPPPASPAPAAVPPPVSAAPPATSATPPATAAGTAPAAEPAVSTLNPGEPASR